MLAANTSTVSVPRQSMFLLGPLLLMVRQLQCWVSTLAKRPAIRYTLHLFVLQLMASFLLCFLLLQAQLQTELAPYGIDTQCIDRYIVRCPCRQQPPNVFTAYPHGSCPARTDLCSMQHECAAHMQRTALTRAFLATTGTCI